MLNMEEFKKPSDINNKQPQVTEKVEICEKKTDNKPVVPILIKQESPYVVPKWSGKPSNQENNYKFEVLKSGSILEEIQNLQTKPFWLFGRLEQNDIVMSHPTISRFHAVLQYRPNDDDSTEPENEEEIKKRSSKIESGWYIYDLESTHGTFLNKLIIPPKTYIRIRVGHMLKFGASSRSYILQGPDCDEEPESELTVTELKERRKQEEELKKKQEEMQIEKREKEGISWGMSEDAEEETDLSVNPYAITNNEELFLDDPKKTLRGFFEREGLNLEYKCDEMSPGTFVCRIELPVDDNNGKAITAEVCLKGKKKESVVQCALEACRILDRHGVLRQSYHEPLKRKIPTTNSDDEDDFLDRTGDVERKKQRKALAGQSLTLTYDDLIKQEKELSTKLNDVLNEITEYQENSKRLKENKSSNEDDLDNYMENLTKESVKIDKTEIRKLRVEELRLKTELQKVKRLIKIAKPFDLPPINGLMNNTKEQKSVSLPLFGKRNKFKFIVEKTSSSTSYTKSSTKELKSDEEEFEEDEDDQDVLNTIKIETEKHETIKSETPTKNKTDTKNECKEDKNIQNSKQKLYGPAVIPQEILESAKLSSNDSEIKESIDDDKSTDCHEDNSNTLEDESVPEKIEKITEWIIKSPKQEDVEMKEDEIDEKNEESKSIDVSQNSETDDASEMNKKRKCRTRNRNRRENVDIDDYDEYVDSEKHSDWIPPKNQVGDGRTKLNDRFGY